jgi:hypothetical protein
LLLSLRYAAARAAATAPLRPRIASIALRKYNTLRRHALCP